MTIYKSSKNRLPGTHWYQVYPKAHKLYSEIIKNTKRRPYVRSAYFNGEKIFLTLFWQHLHQKSNIRDKTRRLKYFPCAIDLIRGCRLAPEAKVNPNRKSEILHRFKGLTPNNEIFFVQIKEYKKNKQKWLVSIFPLE